MKEISDYLDEYAAARKLKNATSYAIAKDLGITKQAVSRYRNGHGSPDADISWRIAEAIGCQPQEILAAGEISRAERAHDPARAATWRHRLQSVSASFIGVLLLGLLAAAPALSRAAAGGLYILCSIEPVSRHCLRRRFQRLQIASI